MIKVLVVDDDPSKRKAIVEVIGAVAGSDSLTIECCGNAADGAAKLKKAEFALIIVDVNLPLRKDDAPIADGGIRFLKQILKAGAFISRPRYIIGLTAFDALAQQFDKEFESEPWQMLRYDAKSDLWKGQLTNLLTHILATESSGERLWTDMDLAILTALKRVELDAVLRLPAEWVAKTFPNDDTVYHIGVFRRKGKRLRVLAAGAIEMGIAASASLATKVIERFRPRCVAMAGIAAGIVNGAGFGDILVADQSWDYCAGKLVHRKEKVDFVPAPNYIPIDSGLKEKFQLFESQRKGVIAGIRDSWPGPLVDSALKLHIGSVATGAAVIESAQMVDEIRRLNKKTIGLDMETYGMYLACRVARSPKPLFFSAKAISDFAAPPKTDDFQPYAAFTSANVIYEFALDHLGQG